MLYAAYGSNLHPERLRQRVSSAMLMGKAVLHGRTLAFHKRSNDGSAKCNIVESNGEVHIAVYDIASEQKHDLDRIEGVGIGYQIEVLDIPVYGKCFTYVATETHVDESLKPFTWYRELVVVGCEYLRVPDHYLEGVGAVESLRDANHRRHRENMLIVHKARNGGGRAAQLRPADRRMK